MVKIECWMCGDSSTELELDDDHGMWLFMVNCDGCGCLLDTEWLESRVLKVREKHGWEDIDACRSVVFDRGSSSWKKLGGQPVSHRLLGVFMAALVMAHATLVYLGNAFLLIPDILFDTSHHRWVLHGLVLVHIVALGMYGGLVILYWNVILCHPGRIHIPTDIQTDNTGYTWCHRCEWIKPPEAHHCRRCGTCVYNMDHHCMYTANTCIGQDNVRHFIRFLQILVLGSGTSSVVSIVYACIFRRRLLQSCFVSWMYAHQHSAASGPLHHIHFLYLFALNWVSNPPSLSDLVWLESFVVSIAACIGSTMMLQRQLTLQSAGTTYLKTTCRSSRCTTTKSKSN